MALVEFLLVTNIGKNHTVIMNVTNETGMKALVALCPQCQSQSLYCGKIQTDLRQLKNKEVLYCRKCKFVSSTDEFKKLLFSV